MKKKKEIQLNLEFWFKMIKQNTSLGYLLTFHDQENTLQTFQLCTFCVKYEYR